MVSQQPLPDLGGRVVNTVTENAYTPLNFVDPKTGQAIGKVFAASTFKFFETYNVVGFLYLVMTIGLALVVRGIEKRSRAAH